MNMDITVIAHIMGNVDRSQRGQPTQRREAGGKEKMKGGDR